MDQTTLSLPTLEPWLKRKTKTVLTFQNPIPLSQVWRAITKSSHRVYLYIFQTSTFNANRFWLVPCHVQVFSPPKKKHVHCRLSFRKDKCLAIVYRQLLSLSALLRSSLQGPHFAQLSCRASAMDLHNCAAILRAFLEGQEDSLVRSLMTPVIPTMKLLTKCPRPFNFFLLQELCQT